jgi:hypothetical protein
MNVKNFNVTSAPTAVSIDFTVFSGDINNYSFTTTQNTVTTPIYVYNVKSLEDEGLKGQYRLFRNANNSISNGTSPGINPTALRGQISTAAVFANQQLVNTSMFEHIFIDRTDLFSPQFVQANKYAAGLDVLTPYLSAPQEGSIWSKTYVTFESIKMTNGMSVGNNAWSQIVGADFPIKNLKHNWKFLPTAFIGYNGGYQTFSGVGMTQNGGQGGLMGTFIHKDLITTIMGYAGGYNNEMSVSGSKDNTGNWFAGGAVKTAYNFRPARNFIVQPNAMFAYNVFGKQRWHSDYGGINMNSGMLSGINVAPGLNLIYNKKDWNLYFTTHYMLNYNDKLSGSAGGITLPSVRQKQGYLEYGIGAMKTFKERLNSYVQVSIRNGARTGVVFQFGLSWKF